jgi:catechol 2,3-dioxygenase-like lactoylglutathione lyase family enzyme
VTVPPFAHLNLTVADVERSEAFYARWFGFDQRPETYSDYTRFVRNRDDFDLAFLPGVPPSPPAPTDAHDEPGYVSVKCLDPDGYEIEVYCE